MKKIYFFAIMLCIPSPCFAAWVTGVISTGWVSPCSTAAGFPDTFSPSTYTSPGGTGSTTITVTGTGNLGFNRTFNVTIANSPVRTYTFSLNSLSSGSCNIKGQYSNCPLPWDDSPVYYDSDGMTCVKDTYDHNICALVPTDLPSAQPCCTNVKKDGFEYAIDKGGACSNLATVCAEGGEEITVGGVTFCGVPRAESTQFECENNGAYWIGGYCYFNAGAPIYAGPNPDDTGTNSTDALEAQNKTNQILKDMVNSSTRDAANIVSAVNTNTDVANQNGSKIVAAILDNKSSIVAAINAKNFNPTINVAAPSVTVEAPAVNIDTSSITNAVQVNGGKLDQTNGKLDQTLGKLDTQTGIFNGISATLGQHLATAQAARDEAAAASGQAIIRADATNGKLDQTNGKLDTANGELNGIKTTLDQHLAVATAARDAASDSKTLLTNIKDGQDSVKLAVDGVKAAIEANGPGGSGTATDMTATNAKLDEIKGLLGSGNPQASQPTAPSGFGERFTGLQDTVIARWDLMKERVLASGAFGSLQQLLGAIPNGGGSTAISINAGRFGDISYNFGNLDQALAILALIFKAIFSVLAIRIILLKGG